MVNKFYSVTDILTINIDFLSSIDYEDDNVILMMSCGFVYKVKVSELSCQFRGFLKRIE
jgi:hypothetical protein